MSEIHRNNLLASFARYRKDISRFFHTDDARSLREKFPGILFGHVLASIKIFEEGHDPALPEVTRFQAAVFDADRLMFEYQGGYRVHADNGFCEMKYIYFPGWAYAKALSIAAEEAEAQQPGSVRSQALAYASRIVQLQLIGYLTGLLKLFGFDKTGLKQNLARRVIGGHLEADLGEFGCYLIYKCVSTVDNHRISPAGSA